MCVIWGHGNEKHNDILKHINKIHPTIKFTMQVETDDKIAMLDVLIPKKKDKDTKYNTTK